jgi:hypothetical protein
LKGEELFMRSRVSVFVLTFAAVVVCAAAPSAEAQERRGVVFGHAGGASIGHADSEMGTVPVFGGGVAFHVTPRLVLDADVHGGRVAHVFGREQHDFTQTTFTGSVLFRSSPDARAHFIGGGGFGVQRAHSEFTEAPFGHVDTTETVRLLHGRVGAEWDLSDRVVLRTEGVLWFGEGLDWVTGARAAIGYRF